MKIIDDLLGGTRTMRAAGETYLYQMELEEDSAYKNRLSRSTLYPALSETLSQMCGRVFFEPINIENVNERIQTEIIPDVDMEGNHLDVFASQWFYAGLAYGVSFVLVDYTQITDARTLAEEKAQGARPYLIHIKPQQVLGVKIDKINGKKQITQFRYVEHITVDDGQFDTKTAKRICVYEIGKVSKYDDIDGAFTLKEEIELKAQGNTILEKDGMKFEMQYHTKQSFELKNGKLHELYEKARILNVSAEELKKLNEEMKNLSDQLETPVDIGKIRN
ncbi:hypothetical protein ACLSYX_08545 [[Pasteurella] aerogenes]